jgi:ketosteroid isomerase-like protein
MPYDVNALLAVWENALPEDDQEAIGVFAGLYHDPVTINGLSMTLAELLVRARITNTMLERRETVILDMVEAGDKVAVAFRMRGRQVGPWQTSLGQLEPDGEELDVRVIDILTLVDGRIASLWMVADELGTLVRRDAVTWKP